MNSKNSKTSDPHKLVLTLTLADKTDLKRKDKYTVLPNLSIYYTWTDTKVIKILAPTRNDKFELLNGQIIFCTRYPRLFCVYYKKS